MLRQWVQKTIVDGQSCEQAAYRKGYSTADNSLSLTLLVEKCREWNEPLWIAFVYFHKAFDTVEHLPLWKTLDELGVQRSYTSILMKLYEGQLATVVARTESRAFPLKRGVKQGDPISSLLFIAVMEAIFRRLKSKWMKLNARRSGDYYGIVVDDAVSPMTNLRFADDVLLLAKSKTDIRKMIVDLSTIASEYGLKIHMGKTVIMTNVVSNRPDSKMWRSLRQGP